MQGALLACGTWHVVACTLGCCTSDCTLQSLTAPLQAGGPLSARAVRFLRTVRQRSLLNVVMNPAVDAQRTFPAVPLPLPLQTRHWGRRPTWGVNPAPAPALLRSQSASPTACQVGGRVVRGAVGRAVRQQPAMCRGWVAHARASPAAPSHHVAAVVGCLWSPPLRLSSFSTVIFRSQRIW